LASVVQEGGREEVRPGFVAAVEGQGERVCCEVEGSEFVIDLCAGEEEGMRKVRVR